MNNIEHPHEEVNCQICWLIENAIKPVIEHQIREKIAKDIEAELCDTPNHGDFHQDWTHEVNTAALKLAANIARGNNEQG